LNEGTGSASDVFSMPPARYIDVRGVQTCYYECGTGPETIVLIHGGNFGTPDSASGAFVWSMAMERLSKRHRVIAFDKLGQGFTAAPARGEEYTMGAVVAHAMSFLGKLALPPLHLVGHSRGGFAAARIALEMPDRVRSLTICSSGTLSTGVGLNEVVLAMPPHASGSREAARWVYEQYCARPESVTEDWVDSVMEILRRPGYQAGVEKYAREGWGVKLFLPDLARMKRETLTWISEGRLQRPVQMIWGANDRTVPIERGLEMYDLIAAHERRASFHVINDAGHFTFREHPDRFATLLESFIDGCKA
jgi:pimeloyl-ACP methyl ester carboxylesterase